MENIQKDHIFTELYMGIHGVMVLMVLVYYVYSQTMEGMMTVMLVIYGIYIGFELYLFATIQCRRRLSFNGGIESGRTDYVGGSG